MCDTSSERFTGRVKWFNNKAGYGFITITDGQKSGTDVFVHHSSVKTGQTQYTYLVQGEYVEFELIPVEKDGFDIQASNVSGIKGGKLMCETRNDFRVARNTYKSSKEDQPVEKRERPVEKKPPAKKVQPARNEKNADGTWTYVGKVNQQKAPQDKTVRKPRTTNKQ